MKKSDYKDLCHAIKGHNHRNASSLDFHNIAVKLPKIFDMQNNTPKSKPKVRTLKNPLYASIVHSNKVQDKDTVRSESCGAMPLNKAKEMILSSLPKQCGRNLLKVAFYNKWIKALMRPCGKKFLRFHDIKLFNRRSCQRNRKHNYKSSLEETQKIKAEIMQDVGRRTRNANSAQSYEGFLARQKKMKGELVKYAKLAKSRNKFADFKRAKC
eukprot:TRINITY_DN16780_c0_g2_i2.p1 TRINITY_DN16780_c0_g2~~TRINITY_DN16780_c0_g2_i2.p1  ORF type:complete len:212 (-),score=19.72 TRINITY_DN16780_c0_g2_i2:100-735(-)